MRTAHREAPEERGKRSEVVPEDREDQRRRMGLGGGGGGGDPKPGGPGGGGGGGNGWAETPLAAQNAIINAKVSLRMSSLLATSAADCHKPSCSQASTPLGKHRAMLSQVQKHLPSRSPAERDDVAA